MSLTLQIKRGLTANLPASAPVGELYYATDTNILYIGTGTSVVELNNGVNLTVSETDVNVLNFPATQPVSGTVSVSNLPSTQPVSGTVSINAIPAGSNLIGQVQVSDGTNVLGTSAHPVKTDPTGTTTQPVSGTVAVSNLPATQSVSGSVSVTNFPATQPVSGFVSVSNFPATQPVSAASLPLPSGAATSAKQPALGTAGAASADVISIQGVASMTPVKVDGSGATQPVSGSVSVSNLPSTQAVSAASLPLPSGAATSAKQPSLGTAGTPSVDVITIQGAASMTALKVDGSATTQPVSGSVKLTDGTNNVTVAALTNSKALAVEIVDGSGTQITSFGGGTQIADGSTSATPTGTVAMGKNGSNVVHALALDSSGNLNVNVQAGGTGGNASVSATAAAAPASATMVGGSDGTNLRAIKVSSAGVVSVDGSAVTQPIQGALTNNNAAPSTSNIGVLPLIANAAPPSWTEGNIVLGSADLAGASRVTIRPPAALGFYSIGVGTGVYVGLAAGAAVFSARWGDATRLALILRVTVSVIQSAAASTAGRVDRRLVIARNFTVSDSGGTAITLTGNNQKMRTSQGSSLFTDMRVASTAALTAGTRTLDSQGIGIAATWANLTTSPTATGTASTTAHNRIIDKYDLFNTTANFNYPIVLAQNEGIIVDMQSAQPASSSLSTFIEVQWAEVNAF